MTENVFLCVNMWCIYNKHTLTNGIRSLSVKNIKVRETMIRVFEKYIINTIITLILLVLKSDLMFSVTTLCNIVT